MNGLRSGVCAGALLVALGAGSALAQDLPGKFEGVTVDARQQFENVEALVQGGRAVSVGLEIRFALRQDPLPCEFWSAYTHGPSRLGRTKALPLSHLTNG